MVKIVQVSVRVISQTHSYVTRKMELAIVKRDGKVLAVQKTFQSALTRPSVVQTLSARRLTDLTYVIAMLDIKRMRLGLVSVSLLVFQYKLEDKYHL